MAMAAVTSISHIILQIGQLCSLRYSIVGMKKHEGRDVYIRKSEGIEDEAAGTRRWLCCYNQRVDRTNDNLKSKIDAHVKKYEAAITGITFFGNWNYMPNVLESLEQNSPFLIRMRIERDDLAVLQLPGEVKYSITHHFHFLVYLEIKNGNLTNNDLIGLARNCKRLNNFRIPGNATLNGENEIENIDEGVGEIINQCKELWCIYLDDTSITDRAIQHVNRLKELMVVSLSGCTALTNEGISYLSACTNLVHIFLDGCVKVSNSEVLSNLEYLTVIWLDKTGIGNDSFSSLSTCKYLSQISLNYTNITEFGEPRLLSIIQNCKNLTAISIGGIQITIYFVAHLRKLKHITDQWFDKSMVTEDMGLFRRAAQAGNVVSQT